MIQMILFLEYRSCDGFDGFSLMYFGGKHAISSLAFRILVRFLLSLIMAHTYVFLVQSLILPSLCFLMISGSKATTTQVNYKT